MIPRPVRYPVRLCIFVFASLCHIFCLCSLFLQNCYFVVSRRLPNILSTPAIHASSPGSLHLDARAFSQFLDPFCISSLPTLTCILDCTTIAKSCSPGASLLKRAVLPRVPGVGDVDKPVHMHDLQAQHQALQRREDARQIGTVGFVVLDWLVVRSALPFAEHVGPDRIELEFSHCAERVSFAGQ